MRQELQSPEKGVIKDFVFMKDYVFVNATVAAQIVSGYKSGKGFTGKSRTNS